MTYKRASDNLEIAKISIIIKRLLTITFMDKITLTFYNI